MTRALRFISTIVLCAFSSACITTPLRELSDAEFCARDGLEYKGTAESSSVGLISQYDSRAYGGMGGQVYTPTRLNSSSRICLAPETDEGRRTVAAAKESADEKEKFNTEVTEERSKAQRPFLIALGVALVGGLVFVLVQGFSETRSKR
jgi:hypothetical protein